jgi:hypothetical protein
MSISAPFYFCHGNITFQGSLIEARLYGEGLRDLISCYEDLHGEVETLNKFKNEIEFLEHLFNKLWEYPDLWVLT